MNESMACEVTCIHNDVVEDLKKKALDSDSVYHLAEFFKIFGDQTRLKIIYILSIREVCVCDIAVILGSSQSAVSHQLKVLRQFKIVKPRKEGKVVYYSLDDDHVRDIFCKGLEHVNE